MMLFRAGSTYVWSADHPPLDLIVALDEASSEIYSALLVEEEGKALRFRAGRSELRRMGCCAPSTLIRVAGHRAAISSISAARGSAQVAQLVEQRTENPCVGGSIPPLGTIKYPR
jgi:hypothetical protein